MHDSATETLLAEKPQKEPIVIRNFRVGDLGGIAYMHHLVYSSRYGFDSSFDRYVFEILYQFLENYDESRDNLWLADYNGKLVGSIGIVGVDGDTAQLRWFLVEPAFQGSGLGKRLMAEALDFCRRRSYRRVFLTTVSILDSARHLYKSCGFRITEEREVSFGRPLTEERWDLLL